jgi:hypothetical protein
MMNQAAGERCGRLRCNRSPNGAARLPGGSAVNEKWGEGSGVERRGVEGRGPDGGAPISNQRAARLAGRQVPFF